MVSFLNPGEIGLRTGYHARYYGQVTGALIGLRVVILVIGVGADLPNTIKDAQGVSGILTDPERCAYLPNQVTLLTGTSATRDAILGALAALVDCTSTSSTVIIYYSGHGYNVSSPTGPAYYLMPYGYDIKQLYMTAISGQEFTDAVARVKAKRLLLLLDCCHAGGIDTARTKAVGLEVSKAPMPAEAQSLFSAGTGRVVIASSRAGELSYAGNPYSAFTLAVIDAFAGVGASVLDGYVRVVDLALYAREVVPRRTQNKQHPIMNFSEADNFVVGYYAGSDTTSKGLPYDEDEVEIEPQPGAFNQIVMGKQTNIGGDVSRPVLSGSFSGPVEISNDHSINIQGGFYQPGWSVSGNVYQTQGDFLMNTDAVRSAQDPIAKLFRDAAQQVRALPTDDQDQVQLAIDKVRVHAEKLQRGDASNETRAALAKHLRRLYNTDLAIGTVVLNGLAAGNGITSPLRDVAGMVKMDVGE